MGCRQVVDTFDGAIKVVYKVKKYHVQKTTITIKGKGAERKGTEISCMAWLYYSSGYSGLRTIFLLQSILAFVRDTLEIA
jgi:hypothetical protein